MPFLAPVIAGALGIGAIGQAVIGTGISLALSYAARRVGPKESDLLAARGQRGAHLSLRLDPKWPREVAVGETATAGTLVYHNTSSGGQVLELVIAISDCPCEALTGLWVNGVEETYDAGTGLTTKYGSNLYVKFYSGSESQTADADLITNSGGRWTSDERGRGVAYAYVRMTYVASVWQGRQPTLLFKIKGAKLYDPRKDSTVGGSGSHRWGTSSTYEWTDNPAVIWYNYRRGLTVNGSRILGMSTPASALTVDLVIAAANACDESVSLKAGGSEKRYRCGGVISARTRHRDVIADLAAAVAGVEIDSGGDIRLSPGVAQSPVLAFTDDDLMSGEEVRTWRKRTRRELVNSVYGSFRDPAQRFDQIALAPRRSSSDITSDAGPLEQTYDLDLVTSATQGERVLEILRRRHRHQMGVRVTLRPRFSVLEAGDWITWTSNRYGFTDQVFEVVTAQRRNDLTVDLVLRETSTWIYSWTAGTDEIDQAAPPDLPSGTLGTAMISGLAVSNVVVQSDDASFQRPGLAASWIAPGDPSIVSVDLEYRRVGDTVALSKRALDASAGQITWLDGVQGETTYQVRARPFCVPDRPSSWTGWVSPEIQTSVQITVVSPGPPADNSVGLDQLDAQTRFEISLVTEVDSVLGSIADLREELDRRIQNAAQAGLEGIVRVRVEEGNRKAEVAAERSARITEDEAIAADLLALTATVDDNTAAITAETTARASADSAIAASVTTLSTTVGGHSTSITSLLGSVDGIEARWGIAIDLDGYVIGRVNLDGTNGTSTFDVVADLFRIAQPGVAGGSVVPVFAIGNVDGTPKLALRGDMLVDGAILARHIDVLSLSAITADIGEVTAGVLRSADNKFVIDLDAKTITINT